MSASRLKFFVMAIWTMIAVVAGAIGLWAVSSPDAQSLLGVGAAPAPTLTPEPDFSSTPLLPSATVSPTRGVIVATRHPGTPIPLPPSSTPITPLPMGLPNSESVMPGYDPLTGKKVDDPSRLQRRPVAVKISSFPREAVRPYQSGLTLADVAYEYYIEDGLTRFIAVFYGQDATRAGPVRSGRYFDEHIMRMYHSSLVFASADERVRDYLIDSDLKPLLFLPRSDNCPPLCRDTTISGYNNYFVNTAGVGSFLSDNSQPALRPSFFYGSLGAVSTHHINTIFTHFSPYSYNYWQYDPSRLQYLRFSDTQDALEGRGEAYAPLIDHLTGQQVVADNVVVLVVPHNFKNDFDRADQVFDIQLIGKGKAYVFSNGFMYEGKWVRDRIDQPLLLYDKVNIPIRLQLGQTFYEVIDPESSINPGDTSIDFTFFIPPRVLTPTVTPTKFHPTATRRSHQ